jgi:hypothetical protein
MGDRPPEEQGFGFSVEMSKAFSDGTLLTYMLSLLSTRQHKAIQDQNAHTWNGHLPLDPFPSHSEEPQVQWAMLKSRQRPSRSSFESALSRHLVVVPIMLPDAHEVEILLHLVCFSFL